MDAPTRLSSWPSVEVRVDCTLCTRRGCYRLARLAHYFGPEMELDALLHHLAADCPWNRGGRAPRKYEARCGVRFTDFDHRRPALKSEPSTRNVPSGPVRIFTLADLPGPTVAIVCRPCGRRGVLSVARLIARLGVDMPLPSVLRALARGCPGLREPTPRCAAVYEDPLRQ